MSRIINLKEIRNKVFPEPYPRSLFVFLLGAGFIAMLLSIPFPPRLFLLGLGILLLVGAIGVGLLLAMKLGIRVSLIQSRSRGDKRLTQLLPKIGLFALAGGGIGACILAIIRFIVLPFLPQIQSRFSVDAGRPIWERVVIAFNAGILEELLFRLFLVTCLAWLICRVRRRGEVPPSAGILWTANALAAIGFGLAHLSSWSSVTQLTPVVVAIVVLLNGIGGLTFGYLYLFQGIEAAMLAHFAADIVVHILGPGFLRI